MGCGVGLEGGGGGGVNWLGQREASTKIYEESKTGMTGRRSPGLVISHSSDVIVNVV